MNFELFKFIVLECLALNGGEVEINDLYEETGKNHDFEYVLDALAENGYTKEYQRDGFLYIALAVKGAIAYRRVKYAA